MPSPDYDLTDEQIAALSARAYEEVIRLISEGMTPQEAIEEVQAAFSAAYYAVMAAALSKTLTRAIGTDQIKDWPVRGVTLSQALYHDAREVASATQKVIADHTRWRHSVRELALELFEGYDFKPSEVLKPAVGLPKYMRDAVAEGEIKALLARMQASTLKTGALKAGYMEALDKVLNSAGEQALQKALKVAVQERYRYFANRIAQTELHRAHISQIAEEYMAWADLEVVEYRLSASHPKPDICDLFARQDLYGLGPGRYPKAECPAPPVHPFCRCIIGPVLDAQVGNHRLSKRAAAAYLRTLDQKTAAMVAGSKAKAQAILSGDNPLKVFNAGRPEGYRIGGLADAILPTPD